ncbi:hypothetical protein BEI60_06800 [Eisenbergiella tayi]|nr:hypothetical protein BEI60_06800 [Eisenbergiella tayi]
MICCPNVSANDIPFMIPRVFSVKQFHDTDLNCIGITRSMTVNKLYFFFPALIDTTPSASQTSLHPVLLGPSALHVPQTTGNPKSAQLIANQPGAERTKMKFIYYNIVHPCGRTYPIMGKAFF